MGCVKLIYYQKEEINRLRQIINWIVDIIVVIVFALFTVHAYGTQVKIAGHSMTPLLRSEDVVLMNRLVYSFGGPKRFDVVVFEREDKKMNVKRVIGLPGETVQVKNGRLYIDGRLLKADNMLDQVSLAGLAENPVILDSDEYFLLGDNRESSEDSRFANIGNVKRRQILGKVWFRAFPVRNIGFISSR